MKTMIKHLTKNNIIDFRLFLVMRNVSLLEIHSHSNCLKNFHLPNQWDLQIHYHHYLHSCCRSVMTLTHLHCYYHLILTHPHLKLLNLQKETLHPLIQLIKDIYFDLTQFILRFLIERIKMMDFSLWIDEEYFAQIHIKCSIWYRICISITEASLKRIVTIREQISY